MQLHYLVGSSIIDEYMSVELAIMGLGKGLVAFCGRAILNNCIPRNINCKIRINKISVSKVSIHWSLVMPYDVMDIGQHWLK